MEQYTHKTKPFGHQADHLEKHAGDPRHALFWEMGTGKSKPSLDTLAMRYEAGEVDAAFILAPNGVHRNWTNDEIPTHLPDRVPRKVFYWQASKVNTKWFQKTMEEAITAPGLSIVAMSYSGMMTAKGWKFIKKFLEKRRAFLIVDEATHLKNPDAKRTKRAFALVRRCNWRRVLTGTPIANGPFDAYSIMKLLDLEFWKKYGLDSFAVFKSHYGVFRETYSKKQERGFKQCVAYQDLDELKFQMGSMSSRHTKDEVLDLPPKLYSKQYFEMTPAQWKAYNELKDDFITYVQGEMVAAPLVITRLLRFQQIASNYVPTEKEDGEPYVELGPVNPRLNLLKDVCATIPHPAIIFAKYQKDVEMITDMLGGTSRVAQYYGLNTDDAREEAKFDFQRGKKDWFVATQSCAAEGLTLNRAQTVVYYNNTYNLIHRMQSEDRAHRIGQEHPVNYIDLTAQDTVDERIVAALVKKRELASIILGDELKDWI